MAKQMYSGSSTTAVETSALRKKGKNGQTKQRGRLHANDGWEDGYMNAKKQKLEEQFNQRRTTGAGAIFAGVAVYVNGYTDPSSDELRRILQLHGGRYEVYLRKTRVTHIVATNLPNSKYRLAETIPVVRPEWITESVAAGKRLPHIPYLLLGNRSKLQSGLKSLKSLASVPTAVKASLEFKSVPSAHDSESKIQSLKVETAEPDVKCDVEFVPETFHTDSCCEVKRANHAEMEGKSEIVTKGSTVGLELNGSDAVKVMNDGGDDDEDVVYNSEEDSNNKGDQSRLTVSILSQNEVSPHKKRSRVYSFRKFQKSDSSTFNPHGAESSTSCDGFIEGFKSGLLDCGEEIGQNVGPSLCAVRIKYNISDLTSDTVSSSNLNSTEEVKTACDKSSALCSSDAKAVETLHLEHSQINCDDDLGLQTEWASQNTESSESRVLNTPEVSVAAVSCKKVGQAEPVRSSVPESMETIRSVEPAISSVLESVEKMCGDIPATSSLPESKISLISPNSVSQQVTCVSVTSHLSLNSAAQQVPCTSEKPHLSLNSNLWEVPCTLETSYSILEPTYTFLKQTSNNSSATVSVLHQTNSSSRESTHGPSTALPASALEPANPVLIQPSYKSSATSAFDPGHSSSKQIFQRSSSSSMPKAGDKNFLNEFYSNSRLHHIATWGAEFKAYVSEIQKLKSHSFSGREKLRQLHVENAMKLGQPETLCSARHGSIQKTVMHIDMDCFFVSVGLLARPELKGKPVAVTHSRGQGARPNPESNLAWERDQWMKKRTSARLKGPTAKTGEDADKDDTETFKDGEHAAGNDATPGASGITNNFQSLAEIASCSYEARKAGVKNGMFVGTALNLCPGLQTIPYDFGEYNRVSRILYDVVASYTHDIEAVSCDEMLIDCNDVLSDTGASPMEFAQMLRAEILEKTGCTSSVGIGPNILLARLATKRAKPNGQFEVTATEAKDFIEDQPVSDLPGVGYSMCRKLTLLGVTTCGDLRKIALSTLKQEFGPKTGEMLHNFSLGQDGREIKGDKQRKSVSAEVNYGIRFSKEMEAVTFLQDLSSEVKRRMDAIGVKGRSITLKLMVRRPDAPVETAKFMGHGICNTFNKSSNLPVATSDEKVIAREVVSLYRAHRVLASDVRGIGIHINKLEKTVTAKGASSGSRRSGYQDITSFTVHRSSNTTANSGSNVTSFAAFTTTTGLAVTSTTATIDSALTSLATATTSIRCATTTYCISSPTTSSTVTSPSCNDMSSNSPYTSLRSSRREFSTQRQVLRLEPSATGNTDISDSPNIYHKPTSTAQSGSVNRSYNTHLHFLRPETCSNIDKNKSVSGTKAYSENMNSLVQDPSSSVQKVNSVAHSKLPVNPMSDFDIPGPSWRVDVLESRMNCGQKFKENASFISESQIDSNVLHELPTEIAREILEDLRARKQQKAGSSVVSPASVPVPASANKNGTLPVHDSGISAEVAVFPGRLPSLSQLDLSCFHALPLHLQDELRAEYARQEVTSQRSADKKAALADEHLTQLQSPSKSNKGRQAAVKNSKKPSLRGRQPGKRALNFGNSKVLSHRTDNGRQTNEKPRAPCLSSGEVIWIDGEDASSSNSSSRDIYACEDSSDQQNLPSVLPHPHGCHVPADSLQPAANVREGQVEDTLEDLTFCGASSLSDVRKLMREWMMSCSEPQDDDISMVTEYLIKLIQHRNLEQAFSLLKFLTRYRRSISQSNSRWRDSLFNITTCVQNVIDACYGATLKL